MQPVANALEAFLLRDTRAIDGRTNERTCDGCLLVIAEDCQVRERDGFQSFCTFFVQQCTNAGSCNQ